MSVCIFVFSFRCTLIRSAPSYVQPHDRRYIDFSLCMCVFTFSFTPSPPAPFLSLVSSLMIGGILTSRSPASAISIVAEMRANGPFTKMAVGGTCTLYVISNVRIIRMKPGLTLTLKRKNHRNETRLVTTGRVWSIPKVVYRRHLHVIRHF